jgi:helicase MOV-10
MYRKHELPSVLRGDPNAPLFEKPKPSVLVIRNPVDGRPVKAPCVKERQDVQIDGKISRSPGLNTNVNIITNRSTLGLGHEDQRASQIPVITLAARPGKYKSSTRSTSPVNSRTNSRPTSPTKPRTAGSAASPAKLPQYYQHTSLDVHAKSFLHSAFVAVNKANAVVFLSRPLLGTDYVHYAAQWAGSKFLRPIASELPAVFLSFHPTDLAELTPRSYHAFFQKNYEQEVKATISQREVYNLYDTFMGIVDPVQNVYALRVPSLKEGIPRIRLGDGLNIRQLTKDARTGMPCGTGFTGMEHRAVVIGLDRVNSLLQVRIDGLNKNLPPGLVTGFNVIFPIQTRSIEMCFRALNIVGSSLNGRRESNEESSWLESMLFPSDDASMTTNNYTHLDNTTVWFDYGINYEQKKAILAIKKQNYGALPFLISGPPGTGKTKTIVESVLQLLNSDGFRGSILVCAPSDQAADILAMRLQKHLGPQRLLRLNDYSRAFAEVPQPLLHYCFVDSKNNMFSLPAFLEMMSFDVVVTTCHDADMLVRARLTNQDLHTVTVGFNSAISKNLAEPPLSLHWAALFVDEAAQALEIDVLVPLTVVMPPRKSTFFPILVMAGDEHQLGPVVHDKNIEFSTSLFERLFTRSVYAKHPLARSKHDGWRNLVFPMPVPAFSNLVRNYRSHPAILAIPSTLFYNNTLICEADATSLIQWIGWQGRKWPVMFSCNTGIDYCEAFTIATGEGWFNKAEAHMAVWYVESLIESALIHQRDICVIAPFMAQVRMIRDMCRERGLYDVNIGPMEAFQGLESRFVVLCTTRARKRFLDEDVQQGRGLVHAPKKFNVAITRAKEGLIVIGNPWLLKADPVWLKFMEFCARNGLMEQDNGSPELEDDDLGLNRETDWKPREGTERDIQGLEKGLIYPESLEQRTQGAKFLFGVGSARNADKFYAAGLAAQDQVENEMKSGGPDISNVFTVEETEGFGDFDRLKQALETRTPNMEHLLPANLLS